MFYKFFGNDKPPDSVSAEFDEEITLLKANLLINYNVDMKVKIRRNRNFTMVTMLDKEHPAPGDWQTEFQFRTCGANNNGIFLKFIRFPKVRQRGGMGTYCVRWLESFAQAFGFNYIVFSSYGTAEGFWHKMGYDYNEDPDFVHKLYFG
jgi:hypothetical protein